MPITLPVLSTIGPPESPGWSAASVSIRPVSFSELPESSRAVIDLPRPVMWPGEELGVPPTPPALPCVVTSCPTSRLLELPSGAVWRPEAPVSWIAATSAPSA